MKSFLFSFAIVVLLCVVLYSAQGVAMRNKGKGQMGKACNIQHFVNKKGCYNDGTTNPGLKRRVLDQQLLNIRDPTSLVYAGWRLRWDFWHQDMRKFVCQCVQIAREYGYKFIGVQFYGECWSAVGSETKYSLAGKSDECIQQIKPKHRPCQQKNKGWACAGKNWTNYVYEVKTAS